MRRKWKQNITKIIGIGILFFLTGCNSVELEERCFPLLAAVGMEGKQVAFGLSFPNLENDNTESESIEQIQLSTAEKSSFSESKEEYESRLNKQVDYNHLKVFVIELDVLKNEKVYYEMLDDLAKTESFPRNTYVCVTDDITKLLETEEKLTQDLGTYLEEYIDKHEQVKTHILTLGDLLDEKENQTLILYLPYLKAEKNYVDWAGYVNTQGEIWQE